MLLEINFGNGDAYEKIDTLMVMSCIILATLKLLSFRLYADNLICNYSSAVDDYSTIDTEEKRTIMRRHAFMGRIICYSTLFFAYLASSIFMLMPMIAGNKDIQVDDVSKTQASELPMPLTFLGDLHIPSSLYFVISTLQYIILMLTSTSNCGNKFNVQKNYMQHSNLIF